MRTRRYIPGKMLLLLMAVAMLGGCTKEELGGGESLPEGKYPLEFTSQMYGMEVTRATSGNTWDGGEEIALKVASDTRKYTVSDKNTGKITAAAGTTPFYWTSTGETKTVSAYYPNTLASASTITVSGAQDNAANYQASDALYAAATSIAFTTAEKKLTFKHLPAKVVANLKAGDGVTAAEVQGATVKFVSQSLTASFNNSTGAVTAASVGSSSVVSNVLATPANGFNKSVQALLVPCQMKGNKFIEVTIGGDKFYYTPTSDTDGKLESGKVSTYEITVKRDGIEVVLKESGPWISGGNEDVQSRSQPMKFTIDLTSYSSDKTYILPFKTSGRTGSYTLVVDWGDGSVATTIQSDKLLSATATTKLLTHTYAEAKEYTITISTSEEDFSKEQIPGFRPGNYRSTTNSNNLKLKSFLTPLLNTGETNFTSCFNGCTNLTGSIPENLFINNPQVTSFNNCFRGCTSLTGAIPEGLFAHNPEVTTFYYVFNNCSKLTSIPSKLFENNKKAESFEYTFGACHSLSSIPSGLFDNNPKVKNFKGCFEECINLTGEIPAGLFENNKEVTNFSSCFKNCMKLTGSIRAELFDKNTEVTTFSECFMYCANMTSIPEKLFANNLLVTDFSYCFAVCSKLTMNANIFCEETSENKATRFKDKSVNFNYCFKGVGSDNSVTSAGTAPALWDYAGTLKPDQCFNGVDKASNIIPSAWKD